MNSKSYQKKIIKHIKYIIKCWISFLTKKIEWTNYSIFKWLKLIKRELVFVISIINIKLSNS